MLLDALKRQGEARDLPEGYTATSIEWVLRLSKDGKFLGLEHQKSKVIASIPKIERSSEVHPNTGLDLLPYVLGTGLAGRKPEFCAVRHAAYRAVLSTLTHPVARIIERFLDDPDRPLLCPMGHTLTDAEFHAVCNTPPVFAADAKTMKRSDPNFFGKLACIVAGTKANHPTGTGQPVMLPLAGNDRVLIEVEGYPLWWMDASIQQAHATRLGAKDAGDTGVVPRGTCSLCGQSSVPLVRIFPAIDSIGKSVSFNGSAWRSYGWDQAYNSPTCRSCVIALTRGGNAIAQDKGNTLLVDDFVICWWAEDPSGSKPWTLVQTIMGKDSSEEDREKALQALPDGHVAIFRKMMGRTALHRYAPVKGSTVAQNLRLWRASCGGVSPDWMSEKISDLGRRSPKGGNAMEIALHRINLWLLLWGEHEVGRRDIAYVEHLMASNPLDGLSTHRRHYWQFLHTLLNPESLMTPRQEYNLRLGKAFAIADDLHYRDAKRKRPKEDPYTLWEQSGASCRQSPVQTWLLLAALAGKSRELQLVLAAAVRILPDPPRQASPNEQVYFVMGFIQEKNARREARLIGGDTDQPSDADKTETETETETLNK